jgi:hypothetical protein
MSRVKSFRLSDSIMDQEFGNRLLNALSGKFSGCPNCGDPKGGHFVPPSLGEEGFFICEKRPKESEAKDE